MHIYKDTHWPQLILRLRQIKDGSVAVYKKCPTTKSSGTNAVVQLKVQQVLLLNQPCHQLPAKRSHLLLQDGQS